MQTGDTFNYHDMSSFVITYHQTSQDVQPQAFLTPVTTSSIVYGH